MRLGAIVRTHDRALLLDILLGELLRYQRFPGMDSMLIHVLADRPTPEVAAVLARYESCLFKLRFSPFPLVSPDGGQRICEAENLQMEDFDDHPVDWIFHADDDHWFEPLHIEEELPVALARQDVDLYYAHQLFFWNDYTSVCDPPTRPHYSPQIFRHFPGDRFPLNRIIQAPEQVHDTAIMEGRTGHLKTPLLDYSCFHEKDRAHLHAMFTGAGKCDSFIASLKAPRARLRLFPCELVASGHFPDTNWRDLYKEKVHERSLQ